MAMRPFLRAALSFYLVLPFSIYRRIPRLQVAGGAAYARICLNCECPRLGTPEFGLTIQFASSRRRVLAFAGILAAPDANTRLSPCLGFGERWREML
jgi:hypothetical protein